MNETSTEKGLLHALIIKEDEPASASYEERTRCDSHSSMSDVDSESGTEDSDDEYEEFRDEESEEFGEWIADRANEDSPATSQRCADEDYQGGNEAAGAALKEFLELLFQLSLS
ncbi:hypothetical protein FALCPG4_011425 [Fusarium falciforme]